MSVLLGTGAGVGVTEVLALAAVLLFLALLYGTSTFSYWRDRGVPYSRPLPFVGSFAPVLLRRTHLQDFLTPMYVRFKDNRFGGLFQAKSPVLLVCDPELIKHFLVKDFASFHSRDDSATDPDDPLSANLGSLKGNQWKYLRNKLSPTFTSGKIKLMFPLMVEVADELGDALRDHCRENNEVEVQDLLTRFTTDLIGTCAFGVKCNALQDPQSEFHRLGRELSSPSKLMILRMLLVTLHPKLGKLLPLKDLMPKAHRFFIDLMSETVEFREKNRVERNDFVNLLMQVREADRLREAAEAAGGQEKDKDQLEMTNAVMAAQAFVFFIAGLDSIANTIAFCLHELAADPDLQERVAREVRAVLDEHAGDYTYEGMQKMDLVDRIVSESLRKHTISALVTRSITAKEYRIPGSDVVLDHRVKLLIPIHQIHHDPEHYPDPERFDPDRFTPEAKQARHPYAYLPFGEGPRVCIAERFARLQMKLGLASLLSKFRFHVGPKTDLTLKLDMNKFLPHPKSGFWLTVTHREQTQTL